MAGDGSVWHRGGCHCGRVRFRVRAPVNPRVVDCNCSICQMTGFQHLLVPRQDFELQSGEDCLTLYTFHTHVAKHLFCRVCGIKSFYVPRSHPDGISVNLRCIDPATLGRIEVQRFDGRHWEEHAGALPPLGSR